jgi:hypothetical protein
MPSDFPDVEILNQYIPNNPQNKWKTSGTALLLGAFRRRKAGTSDPNPGNLRGFGPTVGL